MTKGRLGALRALPPVDRHTRARKHVAVIGFIRP